MSAISFSLVVPPLIDPHGVFQLFSPPRFSCVSQWRGGKKTEYLILVCVCVFVWSYGWRWSCWFSRRSRLCWRGKKVVLGANAREIASGWLNNQPGGVEAKRLVEIFLHSDVKRHTERFDCSPSGPPQRNQTGTDGGRPGLSARAPGEPSSSLFRSNPQGGTDEWTDEGGSSRNKTQGEREEERLQTLKKKIGPIM